MKIWSKGVTYFSHTEDGTALALIRIMTGLVVVSLFLGPMLEHLTQPIWLHARDGGIFHFTKSPFLIHWLGGYSQKLIQTLMMTGVISGLCIALGIGHRVFAFIAIHCILAITGLNPYTPNGGDSLITNMLWLLIFANASQTLSLSSRIFQKSWLSITPVMSWPRYLMILQLCILYVSAGTQKLSIHWVPFGDGQALWYILQMPAYARHEFINLAWLSPILQFLTYFSWTFESLGPLILLLAIRASTITEKKRGKLSQLLVRIRFREFFIVSGIFLHLGIHFSLGVGLFSWATLMYYPAILPQNWLSYFRQRILKQSLGESHIHR
jgi:hypothetical protein